MSTQSSFPTRHQGFKADAQLEPTTRVPSINFDFKTKPGLSIGRFYSRRVDASTAQGRLARQIVEIDLCVQANRTIFTRAALRQKYDC
jgi:hypothetical protein